MNLEEFRRQVNDWGRLGVPFLFLIDFEMERPQAWRVDQLGEDWILFNFNGRGNGLSETNAPVIPWQVSPVSFDEFKTKYERVISHLKRGDSFLTNLTFQSPVQLSVDLKELFFQAKAKYKLWLDQQLLFFSPEAFIRIQGGRITTFPMKGTIDAAIPDAKNVILTDPKELAEHTTIVDLLRNDLSLVATDVNVSRFRYVETIQTTDKTILQVSSEISGQLPFDYKSRLGDILIQLMPAGSISGAPKNKTISIIRDVEGVPRGYYTGVAGYYDGETLDSCVMIRFIEQRGPQFFYRSGGGITSQSSIEKEYQETLAKIYVPSF